MTRSGGGRSVSVTDAAYQAMVAKAKLLGFSYGKRKGVSALVEKVINEAIDRGSGES